MSAFPSSALGLPSSLQYSLPPSMSDSCRSYSVHVAPDGITTVTGPVLTATAFVANSTGQFGAFTNQVISFTLPSGMSDSVYMSPIDTTLSFTMSYTTTTASSATAALLQLIGSGASWFDQLVLYSNNTPVETINQYGLLQNFLLNNTVNQAERIGGISVSMGADSSSMNGLNLGHTGTTTYRYNFSIPLLSVIGINGGDKLLPIGSLNNLQIQLTTANQHPIASYCTAVATQPVFSTGVTLDNFSLNMKYIDVGDMASAMLRQTLQDGKWFIKACTYTNSAQQIPSGSTGALQMLLQIRNSSVKSILHQFGIAPGAVCPNGYYDAIGINSSSRQLQVAGQFYPNKPLDDVRSPAHAYCYLIQALGGSIPRALGTVVDRNAYNAHIPSLYAGCDSTIVVPAAGLRAAAPGGDDYANTIIVKTPNMAYYGYDLEKVGGVLFSGINTRASPPFLNMYLAVAATSNITLQAWGMSDLVLCVDVVSKQLTSFV